MSLSGENQMTKLSKEKKNQLVLTIVLIVAGIAGLYFGLISIQLRHLKELADNKISIADKLNKVEQSIKNADLIDKDLTATSKKLADLEDDMANPSDVNSWLFNNIRQFKLAYKSVDIPQMSTPEVKDMSMLPKFPYKQVSLTVGGTAYFHELGKFIADYENQYPHSRVVNLDIEPTPSVMGGERERLTFKMDIITLVRPGQT
jgi:hypothetical protein